MDTIYADEEASTTEWDKKPGQDHRLIRGSFSASAHRRMTPLQMPVLLSLAQPSPVWDALTRARIQERRGVGMGDEEPLLYQAHKEA